MTLSREAHSTHRGNRYVRALLTGVLVLTTGMGSVWADQDDDLDLGSVAENPVKRLTIHGYADLQYAGDTSDEGGSFIQNELSTFLRATTRDETWTAFGEVEFDRIDGDVFLTDRGGKSVEFEVETAWVEFRHNDQFRLRAGKLLLPQYWQSYHYPNLTMSTLAPLMSGNIFPKSIAAIQASGDWWNENDKGLSYAVFAGGASRTALVELEQNDNLAAGGRLTLHLAGKDRPEWLNTADFSLSALVSEDAHNRSDLIMGFDSQLRLGRLEVLTELARGSLSRYNAGFFERFRRGGGETLGLYVQAAYRVAPKWHLFCRFDYMDTDDRGRAPRDESRYTIGVNFRPRHNISLKLEGFQSDPEGNRDPYTGIASSVVFNF